MEAKSIEKAEHLRMSCLTMSYSIGPRKAMPIEALVPTISRISSKMVSDPKVAIAVGLASVL